MRRPGARPGLFPLNLLLFSAGGYFFGADTRQVKETTFRSGQDALWMIRPAHVPDKAEAPSGRAQVAVTVRTGTGSDRRLAVDSILEILEVSAEEISPFPSLIEPLVLRLGLWGVLSRDDRIYLLIDFPRLVERLPRQPEANPESRSHT